jgi:L-threonylcarbamoyladenylate synthase
VLSLIAGKPMLLRPGMIALADIEAVVGPVSPYRRDSAADPSPGLRVRHYSPRTPLLLVSNGHLPDGEGAYLYLCSPMLSKRSIEMPGDPDRYAALLYSTLHELDELALDWIAVEPPPSSQEWAGILDRLCRAAARTMDESE